MTITLREIAQLLEGRLHGDGSLTISGAAIIRDAQPGDITLADNAKFAPQLAASGASAAIVNASFTPQGLPYIEVSDVHRSFAKILAHLRPQRINAIRGIDAQARVDISAHIAESAYVGPAAQIGPRVMLGENVIIGARTVIHGGVQIMPGCQIGDDCEVFPNVVLYENTVLGPRVVIHSGSVIGAYGFGYECIEGRHRRSAQLGNVEIEADVEIGAGTTIDRGTYGATRIGEGTKIDNQVMIAHNCRIGRHNLICSQVGIAGSASTGDYVVMAGKAGLRDHIHVGDRVVICAQSGVMSDAPAGVSLAGSPAISEREQMQMWAACYRLPEMRKQFKVMQRTVEQLVQDQSAKSLPLRESA